MDMFDAPPPSANGVSSGAMDPMSFMAPEVSQTNSGGGAPEELNGMDALAAMAPPVSNGEADIYAAADPGNAVVKEWEQQLEAKLQKKAQEEVKEKKSKREEAQRDLQKFYQERKDKIAKKVALNRKEEKEWLSLQGSADAGKNPWERVLNLITEPAVKTDAVPVHDVSRFKQVLIQLKGNPVAN